MNQRLAPTLILLCASALAWSGGGLDGLLHAQEPFQGYRPPPKKEYLPPEVNYEQPSNQKPQPPIQPFLDHPGKLFHGTDLTQKLGFEAYRRIWIRWSANTPQRFHGSFRLLGAKMSNLQRLDTTGDGALTLRGTGEEITLRRGADRLADGFVFESFITEDSVLNIALGTGEQDPKKELQCTLAKIPSDGVEYPLDDGTTISVLVEPLPIKLIYKRGSLIFDPEEPFLFNVLFSELSPSAEAKLSCVVTMGPARTDRIIRRIAQTVRIDAEGKPIDPPAFEIPMPSDQGAYDIVLTVTEQAKGRGPAKLLGQRWIQAVVVDRKPQTPTKDKWSFLQEIALKDLPNTPTESPAAGARTIRLAGTEPGHPHKIELTCPGNSLQSFRLSVQSGGRRFRNPSSSQFDVDNRTYAAGRHEFVFWPTSSTSVVTVESSSSSVLAEAKLRIYQAPRLPETTLPTNRSNGRVVSAFLKQPLVPSRFGATQIETKNGHAVADWDHYFFALDRQTRLLSYMGYNTAMVTVAGGGGSCYPSKFIAPTAIYDNSIYLPDGGGTPRKDILELMFRICDREGMRLVPTLKLDFPIAELETQIDEGNADLRMLNDQGQTVWESGLAKGPRGLYYNPLHPDVQTKLRQLVSEIANRYQSHRSFGGVALVIDESTYLQLPNERWGTDASTQKAFEAYATEKQLDGISSQSLLKVWQQWRSGRLTQCLSQIATDLGKTKRRLYVLDRLTRPSGTHQHLRNTMTKSSTSRSMVWVVESGAKSGSNLRAAQNPSQFATFIPKASGTRLSGPAARRSLVQHLVETDMSTIVHELGDSVGGSRTLHGPLTALRSLPYGKYHSVPQTGPSDPSVQSRTTIGTGLSGGYILNNSAWPASVRLQLAQPTDFGTPQSVVGGQAMKAKDSQWVIRLQPYSTAAVRLGENNKVVSYRVSRDRSDLASMANWNRTVQKHITAARAMRIPRFSGPANGQFKEVDDEGNVEHWDLGRGVGITVRRALDNARNNAAIRIRTETPLGWSEPPIGWLRSDRFSLPTTDRLKVQGVVRTGDDFDRSKVRMVLTGRVSGQPFESSVWITKKSPKLANQALPMGVFRQGEITVTGFRRSRGDHLRVVFELHNGGEAWVDQVVAYDKFFSSEELKQLEVYHRQSTEGLAKGEFQQCLTMKNSNLVKRLLATPITSSAAAAEMQVLKTEKRLPVKKPQNPIAQTKPTKVDSPFNRPPNLKPQSSEPITEQPIGSGAENRSVYDVRTSPYYQPKAPGQKLDLIDTPPSITQGPSVDDSDSDIKMIESLPSPRKPQQNEVQKTTVAPTPAAAQQAPKVSWRQRFFGWLRPRAKSTPATPPQSKPTSGRSSVFGSLFRN